MALFKPFRSIRGTGHQCETSIDKLRQSDGVRSANHLTVTQAGELLDWLEGHGIQAQNVSIEPEGRVSVRWTA